MMPNIIIIAPKILLIVSSSLKTKTDTSITEINCNRDAAKAGPTGTFFNKIIQVKKAPI